MSRPIPIQPVVTHGADPGETVWDPYRVFFPLGVLLGIAGVAIWPIYAAGWIGEIRSQWHVDIQLQGFLFAFVLGFLMTALPRFSLTWHATKKELIFFTAVFLAGNFSTLFGFWQGGRTAYAILMTALLLFAARRFFRRKADPPDEFAFVGVGIWTGWVAAMIRLAGVFVELPPPWETLSRRLIAEGMMMLFVIGIGTKLFPLFWGLVSFPPGQILSIERRQRFMSGMKPFYLVLALTIVATLFAEAWGFEGVALKARALITAFMFFGPMKIAKPGKTAGFHAKTLRVAAWAVALSPWGLVFHPHYRVETLHVMFIAGFGILILTIATRVILSHGNFPVEWERRSWPLLIGGLLALLAMFGRSFASLSPENYFMILGLAGVLWIVGLAFWGATFARRAIFVGSANAPSEEKC